MASTQSNQPQPLEMQKKGGPPVFLRRSVANAVIGLYNAFIGLEVLQPQTDGLSVQNTKAADIKKTDQKITITLQPQLNPQSFQGGGGGGGSNLTWLRYKDDLGDCLKCVLWDGATEGAITYIAKPRKIRTTITSETIAGNTYNYSYSLGSADTNGNHYLSRTVSGYATETDNITPPYIYNDELWGAVIPSITLNSEACTLIDVNVDGRAWGQ